MDFSEILKNYLDGSGRLKLYPSKRKYKIISLMYLASKFEKDVFYTEKQVNEVLEQYHTFYDPCLLRRELFNHKFIGRSNNCSTYWKEQQQPTLVELEIESNTCV